ncbi:hypothetical protein TELCIR_11208 [Teladorsagia circumcincta]|uniref:Uncharacterized protein n=1 Tax=Teladorsagia circumcincta TaxID=45464 RepID=A0A2G9UA31_TELCI|nr:hypothetical protein TELCIR_11208 [Teladorsagia circumcincta]
MRSLQLPKKLPHRRQVQNGCEFIGDPAELSHVCSPLENAKDQVTRMVYQSCQAIATDPLLAQAKPNQLWKTIAEFIDKNAPDEYFSFMKVISMEDYLEQQRNSSAPQRRR